MLEFPGWDPGASRPQRSALAIAGHSPAAATTVVACAAAALAPLAWSCGDGRDDPAAPVDESAIAHIMPTAAHDRLYLKLSLHTPPDGALELHVAGRRIAGIPTASDGRFWAFDAQGLRPGRPQTRELRAGRRVLSQPWTLATLPPPTRARGAYASSPTPAPVDTTPSASIDPSPAAGVSCNAP